MRIKHYETRAIVANNALALRVVIEIWHTQLQNELKIRQSLKDLLTEDSQILASPGFSFFRALLGLQREHSSRALCTITKMLD